MYSLVLRLGEKLLISLFLKRPSSLELGRSVLIMGARVIQLIGAILDPAEGSLVGNRFSRGHGGRWQTACPGGQFERRTLEPLTRFEKRA